MRYDVIVIGAGPAGSAAARSCAEQGLSTLCIEENGTIGFPVQCAGLLSNDAFSECRVSGRSVLNRVEGARIVYDSGAELVIDPKETKACVVDRAALDFEMAKAAADAGAEFWLKTAACDVKGTTLYSRGATGHQEIDFKILIAADGPRSTLARLYGMERARVFLAGIQADISFDCDPRLVALYPHVSPEFFGWLIPTGAGRARVGLCGQSDIPARFSAFLTKFGTSTTHLVTGTLPLGIMAKTYGNRTLFIGDAAGFAKPTSGGGVYTGIRSARDAAAVAAEACEKNRFDDAFLARYEARWRPDIGRELDLGFRLFMLRQNMTKEEIDVILSSLNTPDILKIINEYGNMDRPATLIKKLIMQPSLYRCLGPLLASGIRSFF
jgi:geranylgeranyl reductase family protein